MSLFILIMLFIVWSLGSQIVYDCKVIELATFRKPQKYTTLYIPPSNRKSSGMFRGYAPVDKDPSYGMWVGNTSYTFMFFDFGAGNKSEVITLNTKHLIKAILRNKSIIGRRLLLRYLGQSLKRDFEDFRKEMRNYIY